jgi:GcrA cell cycle regulator
MGNSRTHDWTKKRIALLSELWLCGHSSGECARRLGVSRNAAIGKLRRLGLLGRERPQLPTMRLRLPPARMLLKTTEQVSKPPQKPRKRQNQRPLPPPEPYQAPPPPPEPPIGSFNLLDLRQGHCRWPGLQDRAPWTFCGAPQVFDSSYCSEHHAMAHNRGSQRDYDRMAAQALGGKLFASRAGVME